MKTAFWVAALTFSLAISGHGVCFAQSGFGSTPEGERAMAAQGSSNEVIVAANLPHSSDEASGYVESLSSETAEPAAPSPKRPGQVTSSKIGIGLKISTLGAGIEAATPLAGKLNLRGGFNMFRYDRGITNNGIQYGGQLRFQSAEAHLDYFPFGGFHISPGVLFYNGNQLTATAMVPGGQTFTLGGTSYQSDTTTPVTGTGKLDFVKVSPSLMLGIGNLIPRSGRHYSFLFEVGGAYQGSARVALNLLGNVCAPGGSSCRAISSDPTVQANVLSEQNTISKDINPYRFFPVISLGVGFNF
jgi:hypothetical protein